MIEKYFVHKDCGGYLDFDSFGNFRCRKCLFVSKNKDFIEIEERGWLTKAIVNKIKNRKLNKKKAEIEELKLDIEKAKLTKQLKEIKK